MTIDKKVSALVGAINWKCASSMTVLSGEQPHIRRITASVIDLRRIAAKCGVDVSALLGSEG